MFHLPYIVSAERLKKAEMTEKLDLSWKQVKKGCWRALCLRQRSVTSKAWGDSVGAVWMFGYWILEPIWLLYVA